MLKDTDEAVFKVGQAWRYQTRVGEEESFFTIVKVEAHPVIGNIIHISVQEVNVQNPDAPNSIHGISHLPLSEDAVVRSVTKLIGILETLPDFEDGYAQWRQAFDAGEAGIWSAPVAECVDAIEHAINSVVPDESDRN